MTGSEVMAAFLESVQETVRDELWWHAASDPGEHADTHSRMPLPSMPAVPVVPTTSVSATGESKKKKEKEINN